MFEPVGARLVVPVARLARAFTPDRGPCGFSPESARPIFSAYYFLDIPEQKYYKLLIFLTS